jgi:hypothetical protein
LDEQLYETDFAIFPKFVSLVAFFYHLFETTDFFISNPQKSANENTTPIFSLRRGSGQAKIQPNKKGIIFYIDNP